MKTLAAFAMALVPLCGQSLDLHFDALAEKAKQKTEIDLEGPALAQAIPPSIKVSRVAVRSYEFANKGEYSDKDIDALRQQVAKHAGWSRILSTKEPDESTEIYIQNQDGKPTAFLLISAEAKELTVVHVVGSIQLAQLKELVNSTIHYDMPAPAKN